MEKEKLECKKSKTKERISDTDLQRNYQTAQKLITLLDKNSRTEEHPFYYDVPVHLYIKSAVVTPWETVPVFLPWDNK